MLPRLDTKEYYLLHLLECVVNGTQPIEKPETVDWESVFHLAKSHSVANMAYYGVEQLNEKPNTDLLRKWREIQNKAIVKNVRFSIELQKLSDQFASKEIRFMPLKGSVIKQLYPREDMRMMADLDILIDDEQSECVRDIMQARGYECESFRKGVHDNYYKEPFFNVEVHRELMADRMETIHQYYKKGFEYAKASDDNPFMYVMSEEDFYVFHIAHLYKHYSSKGSGIRSFIDIYLMIKNYSAQWNQTRIDDILSELKLQDFEKKARGIAELWFGNRLAHEENYIDEVNYILNSGTYGTMKHYVSNQIEEKGRLGYFFYRAFLPRKMMELSYPFLEKMPFLLPFCWTHRLIVALLTKRNKVLYQLRDVFWYRKV